MKITNCLSRIREQIRTRRQIRHTVSDALKVTQPVAEAVAAKTKEKFAQAEIPITSAVIGQLANVTYHNWGTNRDEKVYDRRTLRQINKLYNESPEKAMDMANRIKAHASSKDYQKLPRDWDYVMDIYKNDYDFITEQLNPDTSLSELEAMHHVKEEVPDEKEYYKYWDFSNELIYPLLEMRKDYPEQVKEILNNNTFRYLLETETFEKENVPYSENMKEFAEFIKDHSWTMKNTLKLLDNHHRTSHENCNSPCNLPDALKYAKMMKENPEATTKILKDYCLASPELVEVLLKHSDNPDILYDFDLYCKWIQPIKMLENHSEVSNYSMPVKKSVLKDLDEFLSSNFLGKLDDLLAEKKQYEDSTDDNKRIFYWKQFWVDVEHCDGREKHTCSLSSILYKILNGINYESFQDLIKTDRETFLRLVKDDIPFYKSTREFGWGTEVYDYTDEEMDTIIKLYQKYPNQEISRDMVNTYAQMDKSVADAFLK